MPQFRTPDGRIVTVPEDQADSAETSGYVPVGVEQAGALAAAPESPDRGVLGGINAAATGLLSGATLGGSDYLLKGILNQGQFERLAAEREEHPIAGGVGQVAGAIIPAFAAPGSLLGKLPSGIVGHATADAVAAGRAIGGAEGVGRALLASGVEGAIQNAGMYLSDTALGDRELSAEGLAASLGPGFAFGVGGGIAALGIEQGTIAARRLFSRAAGTDKAAEAAQSAWSTQYQSTLEANDAAADIARAKLAEARAAREQAQLAKQRASLAVAETEQAAPQIDATYKAAEVEREQVRDAAKAQYEAASGPLPGREGFKGFNAGVSDGRTAAMTAPVEVPDLVTNELTAASAPRGAIDWDAIERSAAMTPEQRALQDRALLSKAREEELAAAVAEHDSARADLDDILRRIDLPDVAPGLVEAPGFKVPPAEWGPPGMRGYDPGNVPAPGPPSVVEAATGDVTAVGKKKLAQGTKPAGDSTTAFDSGELGLRFDPETRTYHDASTPWRKAEEFAPSENATGVFEQPKPSALEGLARMQRDAGEPATGLEGLVDTQRAAGQETKVGAAPELRPSPKTESSPERIEVRRVGKPSAQEFQIPGGRIVTRDEADHFARTSLPEGWGIGSLETHRDFVIAHSIPATPSDVPENALFVIKPSQVADRGIMGNELHPKHLAELREPRRGKLPPLDLKMTPDGRLWIEDGNHRLHVAAAKDDPVVARIRTVDDGWKPQEGHVDISARLRNELPESALAPAATDDLTGQLGAMQSKLDSGAELGKLSKESPAAAEYATKKLAKREADAAYFRERHADAHPSGLESLVGTQRLASKDVAADDFFSNLTRPKTRDAYVAQNIGRAMREEGSHAAALAKVEREWAEMSGHPVSTKAVPDAVEDVAAVAQAVTKYEKSSARLVEALGPDAPPAAQEAAKAFRQAEDHAERKTMERTTRAIDDHAEAQSRANTVEYRGRKESEARMAAGQARNAERRAAAAAAPTPAAPSTPARPSFEDLEAKYGKYAGQPALPPTAKEALAAAKSAKVGAGVDLQRAKLAETEAKIGARSAKDFADQARAAAMEARPVAPGPGPTSTLGAIATTIGVAGELGVPGIPKPHDIPIIGPLLGTYLKYRAIKAAAGRFVGRIPATGDARAAALVARTKDKIATAVDRTLGLAAELAPKARAPLVATAAALGHRLIDDGEPDAPKNANAQQQAAVRIREIANAATQPGLVTDLVRKELRGVTDPDLIAAAEKHLMARFEALNRVMPKAPPPNPYSKREWVPSPAAAHEVAQRLAVVHDPEAAFHDTTPAKAETLRDTWPRLLEFAQQRLIERVGDLKHPVPYENRLRNSLLFSVPLDDSMQPDHAAVLQSANVKAQPMQPPAGPSAPTPSIAGNSNLTALYQTASDRRAMR